MIKKTSTFFLFVVVAISSAEEFKFDEIFADLQNSTTCVPLVKTSKDSLACLIQISMSFNDADEHCRSLNMSLLEIGAHDEDLKQLIFNETREMFGAGGGTLIWINGKKSKDGEWIAYPSGKKIEFIKAKAEVIDEEAPADDLFSELSGHESEWKKYASTTPPEDYYDEDYELCLSIKSFYHQTGYEIDSYGCDHKSYFYCEFNGKISNEI